jgi:prophage antirepressor-like protein
VCRALQLASHKGSRAAHLDKLDDDEKLQISREAIVAATMTPGLNVDALARLGARATRADDPLGMEKGPMAWVVSESGLYTLILRSREATTRGTLAYRFRRWVTGEVLPSIRRTGSYSVAGGGADTVTLSLREAARYIVMVVPGRPPHVRRTRYEAILGEHTALDNQILCHALKSIECLWHKTEQIRSLGDDPTGGFAVDRLEHAVLDGGLLAEQILRSRCEEES